MSLGRRAVFAAPAPQVLTPQLQDLPQYPPAPPSRVLRRLRRISGRIGRACRLQAAVLGAEWHELRSRTPRILREAKGHAPTGGRAICLYASFAESDRVTEMVLRQLEEYTLLGFDVIFVTASRDIPTADWDAVRARCTLVLQRRNYGLDFGSWSDAARAVRARILEAEELLLTNDSVLGPIRPLPPVFAALRAGGEGLFGLTESRQRGTHLQSYLLLARGKRAVGDLLGFLLDMRLSADKAAIIRRGELGLSRHMAKLGHRVAALYGHADLEAAALADPAEVRRLIGMRPFTAAIGLPPSERPAQLRQALAAAEINPTHHLWAPLIRLRGFPFIKAELVTKNSAAVPDAAEWEALVPADAPCPAAVILQHLALRQLRLPGP